MKITTEFVLDRVVNEVYAGNPVTGNIKNWKRIRKAVPMRRYELRVFQNKVDPTLFFTVWNSTWKEAEDTEFHVFQKEWKAPVKGMFPDVLVDDCTGRMLYSMDSEDYDGDVSFGCGPETNGGYLYDSSEGWEDETLKTIFHDYEIDIQASESFHVISPKPNQTIEDLKAIVEDRLIKAGAVKTIR